MKQLSDIFFIGICVTLLDVMWQVTKLIFSVAWAIVEVVIEAVIEAITETETE